MVFIRQISLFVCVVCSIVGIFLLGALWGQQETWAACDALYAAVMYE
jgi:hypothetical protein